MLIKDITMEKLVSLTKAIIDDNGREINNPKPRVVHTGLRPQLSLQDQIRRVLRQEVSMMAQEQDFETYDEANDFDIPDDAPSRVSQYEIMEDERPVTKAPSVEPGAEDPPQPPKAEKGEENENNNDNESD